MTLLIIIAATVIALGAWLRWAVKPVVTAFGLGRELGYMTGKKHRTLLIRTCDHIIRERDAATTALRAAMGLQPDCECDHLEAGHDEAAAGSRKCGYENCWCMEYLPVQTRNPSGPQPVLASA